MPEEQAGTTPTQVVPGSQREVRGLLLLCYLTPLLLLGVLYLPIEPGRYVFWRNWLRAGCGPLAGVLPRVGFDPNDLTTYTVAYGLVWPVALALPP